MSESKPIPVPKEDPPSAKKPYAPPQLREFGTIPQVTQGLCTITPELGGGLVLTSNPNIPCP